MPAKIDPALVAKLARVKLFLSDVDGILTDATVWIGSQGEAKCFYVLDGLALKLLRREGIKVGWISGRPSPATARRARELEVDFLHQSRENKVAIIENILSQTGLAWDDVCYMGDDIVDLGSLRRAGVAVSVPHGVPEAKALADYVTRAEGGHGAVREIAQLILQAQNKWDRLVQDYLA